jgi:hypothetical protein
MLDDLFLIHEEVFPNHLGESQDVVYAAYVVCASAYMLYFRTMILRTDYLLLAIIRILCRLGNRRCSPVLYPGQSPDIGRSKVSRYCPFGPATS